MLAERHLAKGAAFWVITIIFSRKTVIFFTPLFCVSNVAVGVDEFYNVMPPDLHIPLTKNFFFII